MKKQLLTLCLLLMSVGLTACSTWDQWMGVRPNPCPVYVARAGAIPPDGQIPPGTMVASSSPTGERGVGGSIQGSMDSNDKTKLSHALDKTPGRSTQWVNESSGISYTVVPTKKITVGDNPYCRSYNLTATRGGKAREITGTACVSADGSWQGIR